MQPLHLVVTEEIALEGLDGITLDGKFQATSEIPKCFDFCCCSFLVSPFGAA